MNANFYGGVDNEGQDGAAPGKGPPEGGQTHHRKRTLEQKDGVEIGDQECHSTAPLFTVGPCTKADATFTKWWRSQGGIPSRRRIRLLNTYPRAPAHRNGPPLPLFASTLRTLCAVVSTQKYRAGLKFCPLQSFGGMA